VASRDGRLSPEIRKLIRQMSREHPLWGTPRIHGELLKQTRSFAGKEN
jgi:hypothetical protein